MKTPTTYKEMLALFGNPAYPDGSVNRSWVRANIVSMKLPPGYPMFYDGKKVSSIRIHRLLKDDLYAIFVKIWNEVRVQVKQVHGYEQSTAFYDNRTLERLKVLGLDVFSGSYNFRPVRGGISLSSHAFGAAIDLDAPHNAQGTQGRMPPFVIRIFESHGWQWGGRWRRPDPMHFQYRIE